MIKFVIDGRLPSLNEYIGACRCNAYKGANLKRKCQNHINICIKRNRLNLPLKTPCTIHYRWYEPNKRRDKDNVCGFGHKVIQDSLVECGVFKNDGWEDIKGFTDEFYIDKKKPRVEVYIEESKGE